MERIRRVPRLVSLNAITFTTKENVIFPLQWAHEVRNGAQGRVSGQLEG